MKDKKPVRARRGYSTDFKQEVIRMLTSDRSAKDISDTLGIAEKWFATPASLSLEKNNEKKQNRLPEKMATISQQSWPLKLLSYVLKMNA